MTVTLNQRLNRKYMKPQSTSAKNLKVVLTQRLLWLALALFSVEGFSQNSSNQDNPKLTSLETFVENIKAKNESIKNADHLNVMVNDKLVYNLSDFTIDPKSVALVEVLVLKPREGQQLNPSIIINTK